MLEEQGGEMEEVKQEERQTDKEGLGWEILG